jgi:RNA polymerase sigma factor (sigma-70 family)
MRRADGAEKARNQENGPNPSPKWTLRQIPVLEGNFGAWVRRIATNAALDHLKAARREVSLPENLAGGPQPNPALRREAHDRINRAFRELPAKLQVAATLALVEKENYEGIAEALGISVGAVKSRVFRAVRLLRRKLKGISVEL